MKVAVVLIGLFTLPIAIAATPEPATPAFDAAMVILAGIGVECDFNCELDCPADEHELDQNSNGNDQEVEGVGEHDCFEVDGGCAVHSCEPELASLTGLEALIRSMDGGEIGALAAATPKVQLNSERQAIQIRGCRDRIILSLNMSDRQLAALAAD